MAKPPMQTREEREAAAREAAAVRMAERFVSGADLQPKSDMLQRPGTPETPAAPESSESDAPAMPEAGTQQAAQAASPDKSDGTAPARPRKGATAAKTTVAEPLPAPWADANPRVKVGFNTQFPEELHLQLVWIKENRPNTSIQKVVHEAVQIHVAKILKEFYKP